MNISNLEQTEYPIYYQNYLNMVSKETDLLVGFKDNSNTVLDFFESLPSEKLTSAYAEGKWTVKEVFQHLIDTERVFQYRCFCIARRDKNALPGFDENAYVPASKASLKSIESLIEEFKAVRHSFLVLLNSLNEEDLKVVGNVNGNAMSSRAAAFIVLGHYMWHLNIIKECYL